MDKREIRNIVEARLYCLDLAVQSARLLGRAENVEAIADQYFTWATKGVGPAEPTTKTPSAERGRDGDDAGPIGGDKDKGAGTGQGGPASLRQAGATPPAI